jgi:hypothetical protein
MRRFFKILTGAGMLYFTAAFANSMIEGALSVTPVNVLMVANFALATLYLVLGVIFK